MGVTALWQLLGAEQVVEHYRGASADELAHIVQAVDGAAVAVDLSPWLMQADQQQALLPHFSKEERCMKVAFERAVQWLRHGCLPVIVVEGRPPQEKRAAQQARFASRNGYAGGGSQQGASQFQRLGQTLGMMLEELGLPVFYAPGEAEAVCAALSAAGCCDACATPDGDALLYGAESLLHTVKLQTGQPRECELRRVGMAAVRRRLGLRRGGTKALGVLAMLSGSDYDLEGAQGVGSKGGLAVARYLLRGGAAAGQGEPQEDDSEVLERLAELVQRPPRHDLLALTKCTGCQSCGHEASASGRRPTLGCFSPGSGRAGKIKRHTGKNPCRCCTPAEDGGCQDAPCGPCRCAFHRQETERRVERILERVRRKPSFLAEAQAAVGVFERQAREAAAYVEQRLGELGGAPGRKLHWLHRPRVRAVFDYIDARRRQMVWDLPAVRSKLLPVLLEWDLQQEGRGEGEHGPAEGVEFRAVEVQKVHGLKSKIDELTGAHWRYVLRWERVDSDVEGLGELQVQAKKPRAKPGAAGWGAGEYEGDEEAVLSQAASQSASQPAGASPGWMSQPETMSVREFDLRWLKEQPAEHRAVRITAVQRYLPRLEWLFQQRLAGGGASGSGSGSGGKKKQAAAAPAGAPRGNGSGGKKAAAGGGGGGVRKPRADSKAAAARQLLIDYDSGGEEQGQRYGPQYRPKPQLDGDLTRYLVQRRPGQQPAAAPGAPAAAGSRAASKASKPGAGAAVAAAAGGGRDGYGLAGISASEQQQQQRYAQHLPATADGVRALLSKVMDGGSQPAGKTQQQRRERHPPPVQRGSPEKKQRSPRGAVAAGASADPHPASTTAAAAAAAAAEGVGASPGAAASPGGSDFEYVDLVTPPRTNLGRLSPPLQPAADAAWPTGLRCGAAGGKAAVRERRQARVAVISGSPIDLTLDSDTE
ncbi:hypothetical protein CHLNCDRAFT_143468 [Chlorella variabilis]|uniref:XPG-I domain-containing protein n=1 Tax=Chlorella variabilis TaxID=554065 RepID=E1ZAZ3_CHLVA|nr:hypothetical protein CHLNCDRAFT_143468 [Chlorella variabilis]EFN56935.1 hypothetical protein CHLNCDRAFT_143468 [Chlorella variabilis]|eukprot:XP_005849037.1 hypothetical protein CHLNCDRAFT_143468 [Chlorella variabilis]